LNFQPGAASTAPRQGRKGPAGFEAPEEAQLPRQLRQRQQLIKGQGLPNHSPTITHQLFGVNISITKR